MKAKYILSSVLFAVFGILFAACDSDRDDNPTLGPGHTANQFVVNPSPVAGQFIQLSKENTVKLTWNQPNYGVNTVVNYKVQVSLDENTWESLETGFTSTSANISGEEIALALCKLDGFKTEEEYVDMGFRKVAMRVIANIQTTTSKEIEGTSITSNTVYFNNMAAYCNIPTKGILYIIGNCCGWPEPSPGNKQTLVDGGWWIEETEIGSNVFKGVAEMPVGDLVFRFYSKLTGWDGGDSYGFQVDDVATDFEFTNGVFKNTIKKGKGSYSFPGFPGGKLDITVDLGKGTVEFVIL
ncbi:MAG: SusE domain-containing protein [Prevotella sp.]|nr:SusE domain-containing protein [Prevotella sp.]